MVQTVTTTPIRQEVDCSLETSILVAMRSHLHPTPSAKLTSFNPMDLSLSLDVTQTFNSDPAPSTDWEPWGEETTIELCEIQMGFDGATISMCYMIPCIVV